MRKSLPALTLLLCLLAAACNKDKTETPAAAENKYIHAGRGVRVLGQMLSERPLTLPTTVQDLSLDNSGYLHWVAITVTYSQQGAFTEYHRGTLNAATGATLRPDTGFLPYPAGYLIYRATGFRPGTGLLYHSYQNGWDRSITGDGPGFGYRETDNDWNGVLEVAHNGDFLLKCAPYYETSWGVTRQMVAGMLAHDQVARRAFFVASEFIGVIGVQPLDNAGHGVIFAGGGSKLYAYAMDSSATDSLAMPSGAGASSSSVMRIRNSADGSRYIISLADGSATGSGLTVSTYFFNKSSFRLSPALPGQTLEGDAILTVYDTDEEGGIWYVSAAANGAATNLHHRTAGGDQVVAADFVKAGSAYLRVLGNRPYITVGEYIGTVD